MTSKGKPREKGEAIMIRVEGARLAQYKRAVATRRRTDPDLTFSHWLRSAADAQAKKDLSG